MGNPRRKYQSDEDEEVVPRPCFVSTQEPNDRQMRKKLKFMDEDEEEEEVGEKVSKEVGNGIAGDDNKDEQMEFAKPIGDSIRVSGYDRTRRHHFKSFEFDGVTCELEDPVLIVPETNLEKPNVVIIKDIFQTVDGSVMVKGRRFFYPKQAVNEKGWNWQPCDPRELFFSFHLEDVPAEFIMHKCVVHFIPENKPIPDRKQHPGFIVLSVYDMKEKYLFGLTDKSREHTEQHEIDLLVLKTMSRLGELPDAEMQERAYEHEKRNKRLLMKRSMERLAPHTVSSNDERTTGYEPRLKPATPGSVACSESECYGILSKFKARTGNIKRDQWLVKLLQGIQFLWSPKDNGSINAANDSRLKIGSGPGDNNNAAPFLWPDVAVSAVTALERAVDEAYSSDFVKYNQKMRQLYYNLKNNTVLAQRLLKGELGPSKLLKMSSNELKNGLTSEELVSKEPEKATHMQMADARCKRCKEKQVAIKNIIKARHGDRYQMECLVCGYTCYGSHDEATSLSIEKEVTQAGTIGTVPLATAKIGDVEKATEKPDIFRNSTKAYMPVMDRSKKSFDRK